MGEKQPKIAIVHDYLVDRGGAERVVISLSKAFPSAPIYTSVYVPGKTFSYFSDKKIIYSKTLLFLFRLFGSRERIFPAIMLYFRRLNLRKYDLIISSSSTFAIQVRHPKHFCYCHTPARFIWRNTDYNLAKNPIKQFFLNVISAPLRSIDWRAAAQVTCFIANSENIRRRIKSVYGRTAVVIHPAINCGDFSVSRSRKEDYFFILSRLKKYKNIDLAIKVFNELELPLLIAGQGSEANYLKSIAKNNIIFLGKITEKQLRELYANCRAFIFPGEEDFGITPLEAQASGVPVIGYGRGGLLETVIDGKTGVFFDKPTVGALKRAVKTCIKKESSFKPDVIRKQAERFEEKVFIKKIKEILSENE